MAERLIVRLLMQQSECLEWLHINETANPEIHQGTYQDLANYTGSNAITLLLPAADVLLLALDLPVKTASQINKALPFALDDLLAEDVENYHLIWHRQPKDKIYVAAISHEYFQSRLLRFQEAGISLDSVYPETLCLPYQEQSCSIVIDQAYAVLRYGRWLGGGVDVDVLPVFLNRLFEENTGLHSLQLWNSERSPRWLSELPVTLVFHELDRPLRLLQAEASSQTDELNLLSGRYSNKKAAEWQWQKWLPALAFMLLALLLQTGISLNDYWQKKTRLKDLETAALSEFQQAFPEVKRIVNMKAQAEQQLAQLKKQASNGESPFMRLLYRTGEILAVNEGIVLQRIDFINGMLQLQLIAHDIGQIEQFTQALEKAQGLKVKIQSAEAGQNSVDAHVEVREK